MRVEVAVAVMAAVLAMAAAAKRCPKCDIEKCPELDQGTCLSGTVKDDCDCCLVCGKMEGEPCNLNKRDQCGHGLVCKDATSTGAVCHCQFQEILCGTDGKTYTNLCQLSAAAVREQKTNTLRIEKMGPCSPGAKIVTKPEYVRNHTDSNVVLQCEAMGFPSPVMNWGFVNAANQSFNLPGDDDHLVTSSRGGPGKYMVTSWLQIEGLAKHHEGDYTCYADNEGSRDQATARIKVVVP